MVASPRPTVVLVHDGSAENLIGLEHELGEDPCRRTAGLLPELGGTG